MPRSLLQRVRRCLGWGYLIALHALIITLVIYPNSIQRLKRYWNHDPSIMDDYQGMVRAQAVVCAGMPDGAVIFLGDSRMRDLPVREVVNAPAINLSIGGDTTKGMLGRIARYSRLERARLIVVGVGVNDLSHFADDVVIANFRDLLQNLAARGPRIIVTAIFPVNEGKYEQANAAFFSGQKVTNVRIEGVNRAIRELCRAHSSVEFLDVNAALVGPDGNLLGGNSVDGLHLTDQGNAAWATALRSHLIQK